MMNSVAKGRQKAGKPPLWLLDQNLCTDPAQLEVVDQRMLLDWLKNWSVKFLGLPLTNDKIAELALAGSRKIVEQWRANPAAEWFRVMPVHRRLLLIYQLREQLGSRWRPIANLAHFTDHELEILVTEGDTSVVRLARKLGRPKSAVRQKLREMGLQTKCFAPYSADDDRFIRANFARMNTAEIASMLGRTEAAIVTRARALKLKKQMRRVARGH